MSDKSILIVDTPKNCNECSLSAHIGFNRLACLFKRAYVDDKFEKPYWCPLQPYQDNTKQIKTEYDSFKYKKGMEKLFKMNTGKDCDNK